jgi:serine/threonine-protein kinase
MEQVLRFGREQGTGAPSRVADLVALRVERLSGDARKLLQAIAVLGDDTNLRDVRAVVSDQADTSEALGLLLRAGMVEDDGVRLSISHPLIRDVVLASTPAAVRRELHGRAAEVAEARGEPVEVLALHAYHAGNAFQALVLLDRVSAQAAARADLDGSVLALRRGLELARRELMRGELDDPERAVVLFSRKLSDTLLKRGQLSDADGVLREALDLAGPGHPERAHLLLLMAQVAHERERADEARVLLSEARELLVRRPVSELVRSIDALERALGAEARAP